ncbi:PfkB family carbohydrate kinase, partial [Streptococcus merionis]|uniref:PfkB family carbohydrate kinase n=1 Tax=Streptococcus merionis TaxID=400065 RepID=UPI0026F1AF93
IVLQSEGDNRIILDSGANSFPSLSSLSKALDTAQTGDVLLLQFEIPVKDIFESIQLAKQKNLIVILNPTPVQAIPDYIYELVDYLILNQTEAETLVNIYPRSINDCENVFNILQDKGLNSLVLTLGSQGSVWIDRHSKLYYPSEEIQVVDSTGAGDAFIGMFVSGLINKQSPSTILQYCNKVGALTCLKRGAVIGVHSLSEVTKHLNEEEL